VTGFAMNPDMRMAITDDPSQANLFLVDDFADADISICKSNFGLSSGINITTVKVGSSILTPDVTVQFTDNLYDADYVMFRQAEDFTDEGAAAFFAVLWMRVQDQPKQQPISFNIDKTVVGLVVLFLGAGRSVPMRSRHLALSVRDVLKFRCQDNDQPYHRHSRRRRSDMVLSPRCDHLSAMKC